MAARPRAARPDTWEVPDLKNQASYFTRPLSLRNDISARLLDTLTSSEIAQNQANTRRIEKFLRGVVRFGQHEDWQAHRLLGRGGFGTVGLWVRRDANNTIIDELAIKEQSSGLSKAESFTRYEEPGLHFRGLLAEAVIQKQLNEYACENILHLRGYSFITNDNPQPSQPSTSGNRWAAARGNDGQEASQDDTSTSSSSSSGAMDAYRMYTEFSPYQTLSELRDKYRNWHQYLPEPFLWHLFDSLAAAIQVLEKGPQTKFSSTGLTRWTVQKWPTDWGVVHFDIKPGNIFLSYETLEDEAASVTGGSRILGFPVIKLSDYGLAKITGPGDASNPTDYYWRGTRNYRPSEQDHYGAEWRSPPNGKVRPARSPWGVPYPVDAIHKQEARDRNPGWQFGSAANVWNVGKVIYDLTTLSRSSVLNRRIVVNNTHESKYVSNGNHFLDQNSWNSMPFQCACDSDQAPPIPYSAALMELVRECLRPAIKMRIKPDDLRTATQAGLARAEHILDPANADRPIPTKPARSSRSRQAHSPSLHLPKLYCRANEINNMPAGSTQFPHTDQDYFNMMGRTWQDPDWPKLKPPRQIWGDRMDQYGLEEAPEDHNYTILNGRIHFGIRYPAQAPTQNQANVPAPGNNSEGGVVIVISSDDDQGPVAPNVNDDVSMSDLPTVQDLLNPDNH